MFENLFGDLIDKYNGDFNWSFINLCDKTYVDEAQKEIKAGHPLYGMKMHSTAKCDSNDDVMFVISDEKYVIIHLTWNETSNTNYPKYMMFDNLKNCLNFIEMQYIQNYV